MTTLSLKLPPEVAKIMTWVVAAKATGDSRQAAWAKKEYEIARARADQRERWEREREERERQYAREEQERAEREAYWSEFDRLRKEAWAEEDRARERWVRFGFPHAEKDGFLEPQPSHSSQKGWRRLLSECDELVDKRRYAKWGHTRDLFSSGHHSVKHNCGRKPRKPWFKKARRRSH